MATFAFVILFPLLPACTFDAISVANANNAIVLFIFVILLWINNSDSVQGPYQPQYRYKGWGTIADVR